MLGRSFSDTVISTRRIATPLVLAPVAFALLLRHLIALSADSADGNLTYVPHFHDHVRRARKPDTARRARGLNGAVIKRRDRRHVFDEAWNLVNHATNRHVLHHLPIERGANTQLLDVFDLTARHDPRPYRATAVKVLARRDLPRMKLPVSHAALVHDREASDMLERL